jgi:hypothetical protein
VKAEKTVATANIITEYKIIQSEREKERYLKIFFGEHSTYK